VDKVLHVGDPVAFVIAETLDQARDAAELVVVDYEDLPATTDTDLADQPGAPQIHPEAPDNRSFTWEFGDAAATAAGMDKAVHTIHLKLINNRIIVNAMEPRAAIGNYEGDAETGRYTLHTPTQGVPKASAKMSSGSCILSTCGSMVSELPRRLDTSAEMESLSRNHLAFLSG